MSAPAAPESEPAGLLSDMTLADLQLQRQPFAELAAGDEPFADETTTEQLADIKQALITGDDLLLVLGEPGAGKSTLLAQLGANSGLRIQCFSVRGSARFSTHNLFTGMLEAFKQAPPEDLKDMLDALVPCLQGMVANNILSAIVLDNADSVTDGELTRLLSSMLYLNSQDETLMRVALAAEDSFEDRIPELLPEGADLPYSSLSVEPFDDERAAGYLAYRLGKAGWLDALPFSDEQLMDINERAGGRPRSLHQEAAGVLEARSRGAGEVVPPPPLDDPIDAGGESHAPQATTARPTVPRRAAGGRGPKLALAGVAVALIGGGLWLSRPGGPSDQTPGYTVLEQRPVDSSAPGISLVREDGLDAVDATPAGANPEPGAPADEPPSPDPAPLPPPEPPPEPAPEPAPAPVVAPDPLTAETDLPDPVQPSDPESTADAGTRRDDELLEPLASAGQASEPAPAVAPPLPADDSRPFAPLPIDEDERSGLPLESSTWILLQEPERFTVQMSASTDRASVENFLQRAELDAPNSIFAFDRDGATWYALVHGLYASIDEAREAVERMPAQAQSNQPWIRAVGRIQAVLKEQN